MLAQKADDTVDCVISRSRRLFALLGSFTFFVNLFFVKIKAKYLKSPINLAQIINIFPELCPVLIISPPPL